MPFVRNPDYLLGIAHAQHNTVTWTSNNTTHMIHYYMIQYCIISDITILYYIIIHCGVTYCIIVSYDTISYESLWYWTLLVHWFNNNKPHDAISHHIWRYNLIAYKKFIDLAYQKQVYFHNIQRTGYVFKSFLWLYLDLISIFGINASTQHLALQ